MSPASLPDLRPLTMGELIDRAASFWKRHWKALFALSLGFNLVTFVASRAYQAALPRLAPLFANPTQHPEAAQSAPMEVLVQLGGMLGSVLILLAFSSYVSMLLSVAVTDYAWPRFVGRTSSVSGAFGRLRRRAGTTTVAYAVSLGWALLALTVASAPGAVLLVAALFANGGAIAVVLALAGIPLLLLGWAFALVWYLLRFLLVGQVIAVEDAGALGAIRRAGHLLSGRIGPGLIGWVKVRASIVTTAMVLILVVISSIGGLPAMVVQLAYRDPADPLGVNLPLGPTLLTIAAQLVGVVGQSVFGAMYVLLAVLLYLDLRVRREGLDLEQRLDALPGRS